MAKKAVHYMGESLIWDGTSPLRKGIMATYTINYVGIFYNENIGSASPVSISFTTSSGKGKKEVAQEIRDRWPFLKGHKPDHDDNGTLRFTEMAGVSAVHTIRVDGGPRKLIPEDKDNPYVVLGNILYEHLSVYARSS